MVAVDMVAVTSDGGGELAARARGGDRLAVINGLRGMAITLVIFFHLLLGTLPQHGLSVEIFGAAVSLSPLLTNGWTGVNLFFILSGFVLFLPYAADAGRMSELSERMRFYRRRFLRLAPLFFIASVVAWLLTAARHGNARVEDLLSVLSLEFTLDPHRFSPPFNPALWSIGVECVFSALFPLLVIAARRVGMARLVAGILVLALAARLIGIHRFPALQGATLNSDAFVCRLDEFVLGMMLARLYVEGRLPARAGRWALAGVALIALAWIGFDLVLRGRLPPLMRAGLNDVLDAGLCALVYAALKPGTRLAAALSWSPLQRLGIMCYSLYVWHWPLLQLIAPNRAAMTPAALALAVPLFLAATIAVAALSYRLIEFPAGRYGLWRFPAVRRRPA
ncbi:MAG TPA: acyltransferase [Stellaceae bacterium]|nr:acyltransferase [Stellaceae bacterium]